MVNQLIQNYQKLNYFRRIYLFFMLFKSEYYSSLNKTIADGMICSINKVRDLANKVPRNKSNKIVDVVNIFGKKKNQFKV